MKKLYLIYVVMLLSDECICQQPKTMVRLTDLVVLCSSVLSTALFKICDKKIGILKRDTSAMLDKLMSDSMLEYRKSQRTLAEERWRRVRRQVANECCEKQCTIAQIIQYCSEGSRLVMEEPDLFN